MSENEKILTLFILMLAFVSILILRIKTNKVKDDLEERKANEDIGKFFRGVTDRLDALRMIIAIIILGIIFLIFGSE